MKQEYKRTAVIMYTATCLLWFSIYFYAPFLSTYSEKMGANYTMIGAILSSYGFVQLVARLPIGIWSDSVNKRKFFMVLGMTSALLAGTGLFFAASPAVLLAFRSLAGFAASTWAIYMVSFGGYFTAEGQSKSMGIIGTAMFVGQGAATFLSGIAATYIDERWTFLISSFAGAAGIILLFTAPEPQLARRQTPKASDFITMLKNRDLLFFSVMAVILQIASFTGAFGFVPNVLRDMGADNFTLGLSSTLAIILAIPASYFSGSFFEKKLGIRPSLITSFVVTALSLSVMGFAKSQAAVLLLVLASGAPRGVLQPMLNSLAIRGVNPAVRSSAASLFQSIYGFGMTVGPVVAGALADAYGMTAAFVAVGVFTLSAAVCVAFKKSWPGWVTE